MTFFRSAILPVLGLAIGVAGVATARSDAVAQSRSECLAAERAATVDDHERVFRFEAPAGVDLQTLIDRCLGEWARLPDNSDLPRAAAVFLELQGRLPESIDHMEKAADLGNVRAGYLFGSYLLFQGIDRDRGLAMMERAAERGSAVSSLFLGAVYSEGQLVEADCGKANAHIQDALRQGIWQAEFLIGSNLVNGTCGPKNPELGLFYIREVAARGHRPARFVAASTEVTESTNPARKREGLEELQALSEEGFDLATLRLYFLYATGGAVERDPDRAAFHGCRLKRSKPAFARKFPEIDGLTCPAG